MPDHAQIDSGTSNALVIVNGASSAGKTLAIQAFLNRAGPNWIYTGLDDILDRRRPFGPEPTTAWTAFQRTLRVGWFNLTDGRLQLFKALHAEAVSLVHAGKSVIIETSLMDKRALHDAAQQFASLNGLFIGMQPPLDVSERWEAERGDRPIGHARKHYELIHAHNTYDLVLDSSILTPDECALAI